jgi:hypothetical protein
VTPPAPPSSNWTVGVCTRGAGRHQREGGGQQSDASKEVSGAHGRRRHGFRLCPLPTEPDSNTLEIGASSSGGEAGGRRRRQALKRKGRRPCVPDRIAGATAAPTSTQPTDPAVGSVDPTTDGANRGSGDRHRPLLAGRRSRLTGI